MNKHYTNRLHWLALTVALLTFTVALAGWRTQAGGWSLGQLASNSFTPFTNAAGKMTGGGAVPVPMALPAPLFANVTVTKLADTNDGVCDADCSLREAIAAAASGDTITFAVTGTIVLGGTELTIDKDLTIQGPGAQLLTISGNQASRVFNIGNVTPAINVTLSGLTIANGKVTGTNTFVEGGGINNRSTGILTVINSTLTNNSVSVTGGGRAQGGAIYSNGANGTLNVTNSTLTNNSASATGSDNNGIGGFVRAAGIFNDGTSSTVNVTNSTLSNNSASSQSGRAWGGGINNNGTLAPLSVTDSTLTNNSVSSGGNDARGGGIYSGATQGVFTLTKSTLAHNSALSSGNGSALGGGIFSDGTLGTVNVINSTLAHNSVSDTGGSSAIARGGGIHHRTSSATVTVTNSTLAYNSASASGGATSNTAQGGGISNDGPVNMKSAIVALNSVMATGNTPTAQGPDVQGTFTSQGFNLIGKNDNSTGFTHGQNQDQVGSIAQPLDPLLGALANNGGPTQTLALLTGSPALDKGISNGLTTDQRGFARTVDFPATANATGGDGTDIGAVEICLQPTITLQPQSTMAVTGGNAQFMAGADGVPAPTVQWQVSTDGGANFTNVANATSSTLSLGPVSAGMNGNQYQAVFSNSCGSVTSDRATLLVNSPPTITPSGISRAAGSQASNSTIATVSDNESAAGTLVVTITSANPSNGVTLSNIANSNGTITANAVATCGATNASFTLQVSDGNLTATGTLNVTVTPDVIPPTITCAANQSVISTVPVAVNYPAPTASDNCAGVTTACVPPAGSVFQLGVTTVNCTATDAVNLTATCSFTVSINNTPVGSPLTVNLPPVTVTFDNVTTPGVTTVTPIVPVPTTPPPPNGYFIQNTNFAYDVSTTAGYNGAVTVCFTVPGSLLGTVKFGNLRILHLENGVWVDRTILAPNTPAPNQTTLTICARTTTLSPFVLASLVESPGPGLLASPTSEMSDQKAGSVLVYNVYTSGASSSNTQNTRINLTNTNPRQSVNVHLFFVAEGCSIADSYVCLTQNQTTSFLASDLDPGTSGYLVAVAVDDRGCPTFFNYLIGDEYVKFASGHAANLAAEAFAQLDGGLPSCDGNSVTAQLNFDGTSYNRLPATLALSNIGSRADGNDTLLIVNRIGGNLGIGASTLGTLFGILYDDAENALSFSVAGNCQLRNSITNNFPRTTPRFETFIPAGRTGWLKIFNQTGAAGITGAAINFNANAASSAGAFNQGHNLHGLTLNATNSYTIPVFPPSC
ncbi:MAG: choice-of-anchor Q domain-containing protein [Blastocatellia bacterium]